MLLGVLNPDTLQFLIKGLIGEHKYEKISFSFERTFYSFLGFEVQRYEKLL